MIAQGVHLVYHGTCLIYAQAVRRGISLVTQRPQTDFGQGFYTTTQWEQALMWAGQTSRRYQADTGDLSEPAVLVFTINPAEWRSLNGRTFPAWPFSSAAAARFVRACRASTGLNHPHDYVYGPLFRDPLANPTPIPGRDQLSVHTNRAVRILSTGLVGVWVKGGDQGWQWETP